ncbi:MAG: chemotaxis protein CheW [Clostridia bacterium]|nr:chemotaxis protein CheW [Clostridia bacterium]
MAEMQIVVFSLNDETCGADTSQVFKIEKYQKVDKIPEMPYFVDGIMNLRGRVVPVVNLNRRFDLGQTEITKKTKIIITEIDKGLVGFVVNDVQEIIKLSDDEIESPPGVIQKKDNSYMNGVGKKGEKLISILDLRAILGSEEIEDINKVLPEEEKNKQP